MRKFTHLTVILSLIFCSYDKCSANFDNQSNISPEIHENLTQKELFEKANIAYLNNDFENAIQGYKNALKKGHSCALYFNLGNAYFQKKEFGFAILNYERALFFDSKNPEILSNLRLAKTSVGLEEKMQSSWEKFLNIFTLNTWIWLLTITFWLAIFHLLQTIFIKKKISLFNGLIFAIVLFLFFVVFTNYTNFASFGIITSKDCALKISPIKESPVLEKLKSGQNVRIEHEKANDHILVKLQNGQIGWVSKNEIECAFFH